MTLNFVLSSSDSHGITFSTKRVSLCTLLGVLPRELGEALVRLCHNLHVPLSRRVVEVFHSLQSTCEVLSVAKNSANVEE